MKTKWQKALAIGLMAIGIGAVSRQAQASSTDTITLSVTPGNITYGVSISSPYASGYNFGQVNLGATTISTLAITVTATGANVSEFFGLAVSNTSGGWAPAGAPGADQFRMTGWFNAGTQPLVSDFVTADALATTVVAASGKYNESGKTAPAGSKSLWLRLDMPTTLNTGTLAAQTMTLTVTGQPN